jgi:hypothetical protein
MSMLKGAVLLGMLAASTLASATQVFTGNLANHNDFGGGFFSISQESNVTIWSNSANFDSSTGLLGNFDHYLTLWRVEGSNAMVIQTANETLFSRTPIDPSQDLYDEVLQTVLGVGTYAFAITAVDELGNANSPIISFTNAATGTSADKVAYAWGTEDPVPWEFWTDPAKAGIDFATGYSNPVGNFWQVNVDVNPVPVPGAVWLFGSALAGFVGFGRKKRA